MPLRLPTHLACLLGGHFGWVLLLHFQGSSRGVWDICREDHAVVPPDLIVKLRLRMMRVA